MTSDKKNISIWNEIKRFIGFMSKKTAVDQLNDTTAFPWFLNFFKNCSADIRKCKSNHWDYLMSTYDFKNSNEPTNPSKKEPVDKRNYLINQYNERLLFYSKDKVNPWVVDDREQAYVVLHRKNYLEFEKKIAFIIDQEIENKISNKKLSKKEIKLERKRLWRLEKLALLKTYKEENLRVDLFLDVSRLDWQEVCKQFMQLVSLELNFNTVEKEIKKQQEKIAREFHVCFSKETESVKIYSVVSIWEKVNKFVVKNKGVQYFSLLWYGFISHANVLNWISFLLLFFSLSLCSYPVIFLILGISLISYLGFHFFFLFKKESLVFPEIITDEAEKILELVKIEVFNEEKRKNEFKLIVELIDDLSRENTNKEALGSISIVQENPPLLHLPSLSIEQSTLYRYVTTVYPTTQFITSLTVNLTSVLLYTYLLTWAMHSFLTVLGAMNLATLIASPLAVGILILLTSSFFLTRHLFEFRAREDFYHRTILNRLNEQCESLFTKSEGGQCKKLTKWEKFEYLQHNIYLSEVKFKRLLAKNNVDHLNDKFYSLFNSCMIKKNVYNSNEEDKVLGDSSLHFKRFKNFLNRFFSFSGGGFYGYNLTQQIVWKSKLGIQAVKVLTLPIVLIFIPLIILNGIANLITYHLHSRQEDRFQIVKNLDSKLEILEQTSKELFVLVTLLSLECKHSSDRAVNLNANSETQLDSQSVNKHICSKKRSNQMFFFKECYKKISVNEKKDNHFFRVLN